MSTLTAKSVKRTLFDMAFPMLAGTFAMSAYNLTDTYFVSRLGTLPLAAMGFTFPVVMFLTFVAGGIGTGATTLVSHAIGRGDREDAARLTTHGLLLIVLTTASLATAGALTIEPLFARLGADAATLVPIGDFMRTWYWGAIFMALPMFGNGILVSSGDSAGASRLMMAGMIVNMLLNPVLILGLAGAPAFGIRGSALATNVAQAASAVWLVASLRRHRLLVSATVRPAELLASWRRILKIGVPSVVTMMLIPISAAAVTRILASFGSATIAAVGAATRLEMFAFVIPMALGITMTPFVSQNCGAGRIDRIREARTLAYRFALGYGAVITALFWSCAPAIAGLFSDDPAVVTVIVTNIRIVSFGYGLMEVHRYSGFILTGLQHPVSTTILNAIRVIVLLIPLTLLGTHCGGVRGAFAGRLATDFIGGIVGIVWSGRACRRAAAAPGRSGSSREIPLSRASHS